MKTRYLVCYDYGQGGLWYFVIADSAEQIQRLYPELTVATERFEWMTQEWMSRIEAKGVHSVEDQNDGFLGELLKQRRRS